MNKDEKPFGISYYVFDRRNYRVFKERFFKTAKARDNFVKKVEEKENFITFIGYVDPIGSYANRILKKENGNG